MCTKACYLNGKFTSRKPALNMSNILALAGLRCHRTFLPAGQKPAQSWSQSQESHWSHQALWAISAAGTSFRHGVIVDALAEACGREFMVSGGKLKASGSRSIALDLFALSVCFPWTLRKDLMWILRACEPTAYNWSNDTQWQTAPRLIKKRYFCNTMTYYFIFLYTLILHFKLLYLNFYFFSFLLSWYFKVKDYLLWREARVYWFLGTVNVYYNFSHHYCCYMYSEDLKIIFEKCSFAFFIIYFNFGIF